MVSCLTPDKGGKSGDGLQLLMRVVEARGDDVFAYLLTLFGLNDIAYLTTNEAERIYAILDNATARD